METLETTICMDLSRKYTVLDNLCDVLEDTKLTTRYMWKDIGTQEEYTHCDMTENGSVKTNFHGTIPIWYTFQDQETV